MSRKLGVKIGDRYGRLMILAEITETQERRSFLCRCDCGKELKAYLYKINFGRTKSCGCLKKEFLINRNLKHGHSNTKLYKVWRMMKQRCFDKNNNRYSNYGGRGIKVCAQWLVFDLFYEWAINNGFKEGLTIERRNNNGNYEPENCTWISLQEQAINRRTNKHIEFNGKVLVLQQWSELLRIDYDVLQWRLSHGWSVERAFKMPIRKISRGTGPTSNIIRTPVTSG